MQSFGIGAYILPLFGMVAYKYYSNICMQLYQKRAIFITTIPKGAKFVHNIICKNNLYAVFWDRCIHITPFWYGCVQILQQYLYATIPKKSNIYNNHIKGCKICT